MKQKLFLFLLALVTSMGAWGNLTPVTSLTSGNDYYFYNSRFNQYINSALKTDVNHLNAIKFTVTESSGAYNLYSADKSGYLTWGTLGNGQAPTISAETSENTLWTIDVQDGTVMNIYPKGQSAYELISQSATADKLIALWGWNNQGGQWYIYEADEFETAWGAYDKAKGWMANILLAEGLVTNASNYSGNAIIPSADGGGLPTLLDNNTSTFCHTAYSGSGTADPGADHYIQAYVEDGTDAFYLYTYKRNNNNRPTQINITASNDGSSWTNITSLTSGLTTNDDYLSDKISLNGTYKYIRFTVPSTNTGAKFGDHVFFTYAEFWLLPSNSHVDEAVAIVKNLSSGFDLTDAEISEINRVDVAVRSATIAPWKAAFIASAGESSNFGKVGWPSSAAYTTFCNTINALTVDDDYEADAATAMATLWSTVTYPTTGYYYLQNKGTGRSAFSDEGISSSQDFVNDESRTSKYIWKVTLDGTSVKIYSLTGHGLTLNNNGGEQTGFITLETPDANNYTAARGAFYVGSIQDPNQNSFTLNGGAYVSATNPMKLTYWNGGSGANQGDRQGGKAYWIFESIDASAYDVYTVNIVGAPDDNYVEYTGSATTCNKKVYNGGQYFITKDAAVASTDFTPETISGYATNVTISDKTITVTYTVTDYLALITDYLTAAKQQNIANAGHLGYMQNTGDDFTNLMNLLLTFNDPAHVYTESDYNNLVTYYEACAANPVYPTTGKFYLVKNNSSKKYMRVTAGNGTKEAVKADLTYEEAVKDASAHVYFTIADAELVMRSQDQYFNWVYYNWNGYSAYVQASKDKHVHFANPAPGLIAFSIAYGDGSTQENMDAGFYSLPYEGGEVVYGSPSDGASNVLAQWIFEEVTSMNVDLHSDEAGSPTYYATLCLPFDVTISGADAYTLEESAGWLVPTAVEDNKVPAGTPVLLKGTSNDTATATFNSGSAFNSGSPLDCDLTGTYFAKTIAGATDYVLGIDSGVVGFYHWNSNNLAANRAYVAGSGSGNAKGYVLDFEDDATGISLTPALSEGEEAIYNLAGQRINKMQKGINIVNGKKILY